MLFGLLPLIILGGVIALIVRAVRGSGSATAPGPVLVRRFFQYTVLYGVLIVVAVGLSGLLEQMLPEGEIIRRGSTDAARSIAFAIVGVPVYLGIGAWVNRQLDDPRERSSLGWSFYLTASLITALLVAGFAAFDLLQWAFGLEAFDAASFSRAVVWGLVWLAHWVVIARYLDHPRGEGHLVAGSAVSLLAMTSWLVFGLFTSLDALYANIFETRVADFATDDLRMTAAGLVVSGAAWWIYWLRNGVRLHRTALWNAYVLLLGVFSGLVAAIGSAATFLYTVLVWFLGEPDNEAAARHFEVAPALLAITLIGLAAFFYHRAVLADRGPRQRTEIRRVYEYVIAGLGLLAAAAGIVIIVVALIEQIVPAAQLIEADSDINVVLAAVTLLVTGVPIWLGFWRRIQVFRMSDPAAELRSPTRRAYLAILFGVGGIAALISLVTAVFRLIEDLLDGVLGAATVSDIGPAIALVVATGAVAGYHWVVYREDRGETPESIRSPLREVILVGAANPNAGSQLAERLDVRVRTWRRTEHQPAPLNVDSLVVDLSELTEERVLVIATLGGHQVIPFEEVR